MTTVVKTEAVLRIAGSLALTAMQMYDIVKKDNDLTDEQLQAMIDESDEFQSIKIAELRQKFSED